MKHPVQTSRGRCASDNISHDNENPLACCWLLYSNLPPLRPGFDPRDGLKPQINKLYSNLERLVKTPS